MDYEVSSSAEVFESPLDDFFDFDTFIDSLWTIHDLMYTVIDMLPEDKIVKNITSPSGFTLKYTVEKV